MKTEMITTSICLPMYLNQSVILFIPNIKKVSIFIDGQDEPIVREKDNKDWCVSDSLVDDIPEDITDKINDVLKIQTLFVRMVMRKYLRST